MTTQIVNNKYFVDTNSTKKYTLNEIYNTFERVYNGNKVATYYNEKDSVLVDIFYNEDLEPNGYVGNCIITNL
jgi:hypothetical protein